MHESPERAAILIGTQDMLLSRALMRGYAAPRPRWPIEFALVHNDAQWVFDEVQLMGAGLPTSIQIEAFRSSLSLALPSGSLWISATLDPNWLRTVDFDGPRKVIRVPDDFPEDATSKRVRKLIDAPKRLSKTLVAPTSDKKIDVDAYITKLASMIRDLRAPGKRRLVIVNTVERAQKLYRALGNAGVIETDVVLVHSRFRPADRRVQMERLRAGKDDIVVATQAIEAGVDLSSAILVTELAPWSSLVQRFGRANRYGEWNEQGGAIVYWVDLPAELAAPYEAQDLDAARTRLETISDAAPVNLGGPGDLPPSRGVIRRKRTSLTSSTQTLISWVLMWTSHAMFVTRAIPMSVYSATSPRASCGHRATNSVLFPSVGPGVGLTLCENRSCKFMCPTRNRRRAIVHLTALHLAGNGSTGRPGLD